MTKKQTKQKKQSKTPFYGAGTLWLAIAILALVITLLLWGLAYLGVVDIPDLSSSQENGNSASNPNAPTANIAGEPENKPLYEAVPRREYATALANMQFPSEYYRNYRITLSSDDTKYTTEYFVICDNDDWWIQTAVDKTILQTVICHNGKTSITDNAANTSVKIDSDFGPDFEESCGIMTLERLVEIIHAAANGDDIDYGGGISDYSLSFTQTRLSGENLFSFSFSCPNGISENYTFSFENAVILSATKSFDGKEIYKMEIKDYRNDLTEIDVNALFADN